MNASLDLTQLVGLTRQHAAEYLQLHLPFKSTQQWLNYLNDNARGKHAKTIQFAKKGVASFYQRQCLDVFIERKNQELYRQVRHLFRQQHDTALPTQLHTLVDDIHLVAEEDGLTLRAQNQNTVLKLTSTQAKQLMQQLAQHFLTDHCLSRSA